MTLVDTNVLIDILVRDPDWGRWSMNSMDAAVRTGRPILSPIVYGELAPAFSTQKTLDVFVEAAGLALVEPSRSAMYRAGIALRDYRRAGGKRTRRLPDFILGAQAQDLGCAVLTRDPRPFRAYFPEVRLIAP